MTYIIKFENGKVADTMISVKERTKYWLSKCSLDMRWLKSSSEIFHNNGRGSNTVRSLNETYLH